MRIRNWTVAVVATLAASLAGAAAAGGSESASVTDPAGDVKNGVQPWQDIVAGGVVRQGDTFTFSMKMAGVPPANLPAASGGLGWYLWAWGIDTDPDLSPGGWPFPSNQASPTDFFVFVVSDGTQYFAFVGDRRPLADGEDEVITPVPFKIRGSSIQVSVDADLLGDPADFLLWLGSITSHAHFGSEGFDVVDHVDWTPWPQN